MFDGEGGNLPDNHDNVCIRTYMFVCDFSHTFMVKAENPANIAS